MTVPRKHHYVQQAHLGLFANEKGLLFVATKDGKQFETAPLNVFAVRDLYSFDVQDGIETSFESALSEFESDVFPFIKAIAEGAALDPEHREAAVVYMACSMLRNPTFQRMIIDQRRTLLEATLIQLEASGEIPPFPQTGTALDGKPLSQLIAEKHIGFAINNSEYLRAFQEVFGSSLALLSAFELSLLHSDGGNLIIGDHPFTFIHPGMDFGAYGTPLGGDKCELTFPVSKNVCLIGRWETPLPTLRSKAAVAQANTRQAMFASNFLASASSLGPLMPQLAKYRGLSFTSDLTQLPAGNGGSYTITRRALLPSPLRRSLAGDIVQLESLG